MTVELYTGDNLHTLKTLRDQGAKFDLVELDGPYMAGLEGWDTLTEEEYIQHYADRLTVVRDLLQPWGVVFVFGYPEGCAEIKSWAHRTGTLYLRRWLTWYKNQSQHIGRKVESILLFQSGTPRDRILRDFGKMLKEEREKRGWTLQRVSAEALSKGHPQWWHRGGTFYFETSSHGDRKGGKPSSNDLRILASIFGFDEKKWADLLNDTFDGVTTRDFITVPIEEAEHLGERLRSKPVGLYIDLFRPTMPPTENKRALILYGGSGNAGIAAGALGYDVAICEMDGRRVEVIQARYDRMVSRWREKATAQQLSIDSIAAAQMQPSLLEAA